MFFRNYRLGKTWLDKYLKSCVSLDPSTDNMANGSKHSCNVYDSTFTIIINPCAGNYKRKSPF